MDSVLGRDKLADMAGDGERAGGTCSLGAPGNVFYFVHDLAEATRWYVARLSVEPTVRARQLVMFDVAGTRLTLHEADEFNQPGPSGTVAYWTVGDVDATVAQWSAHGATTHRGPKTIMTGERLCQMLDPFGNLLGLCQPPACPTRKQTRVASAGSSTGSHASAKALSTQSALVVSRRFVAQSETALARLLAADLSSLDSVARWVRPPGSFSILPVSASILGLAVSIDPKSLHLTCPVCSRWRRRRPREPPRASHGADRAMGGRCSHC